MSGEMKTKPERARVARISKPRRPSTGAGPLVQLLDDGERGQPGPQGGGELRADDRGRAFDVDLDARAGVLDPAVEAEAAGQAVDVRAEADALDDAEDREAGGGAAGPGRHAGPRLTSCPLRRPAAASRL